MNNKNWLIIGVVVLVALGVWFYFDSREGVGLGPDVISQEPLPDWPLPGKCSDVQIFECGTFADCTTESCCLSVKRCRLTNLYNFGTCQMIECDGAYPEDIERQLDCMEAVIDAIGARKRIINDASDKCTRRVLTAYK